MSTILGDAFIRIRPDMAGFDTGVTGAFKKVAAGATALLAGAGVAAFTKSTLDIGRTYQDTLNNLKAVAGASDAQMAAVGKSAKALGSDLSLTATSAADAATAMTELAKGGLTVDEAMKAAKGTLQLAAAAGISAAEAATIQSSALNAYSLDASQAGRVSDVLANAANAAAGEIGDFAQGMSQASAVAASAGISLEDTAAVLGILANNGIKGSDAGTLMKSALLAMRNTSAPAQKAIAALGLSVYDATGNFVGMESVFGDLQEAQKGMSQEAFEAATNTLFGSDAARLAGIAGKEGAEGFRVMADAMGKQGAAADVAAAKAKGVSGAIEGFQSQVETFQIDLFERVAPHVEGIVRVAAEQFPKFGEHVLGAFDTGIRWAGNFAGAIGDLGAAITNGDYSGKFLEAFDTPDGNPVVKVIQDGRTAVLTMWDGITDVWAGLNFTGLATKIKEEAVAAGKELLIGFNTGMNEGDWAPLGETIITIIGDALSGIVKLSGKLFESFKELMGKVDWVGIGLTIGAQVPSLLAGLALGILNFDLMGLLEGLADNWFEVLMGILAIVFMPAKWLKGIADLLRKIPLVGKFMGWFLEAIQSVGRSIFGWIGDLISGFARGFTGGGSRIVTAVKDVFETVKTQLFVWGDDIIIWFKSIPGKFVQVAEHLGTQLRAKFDEIFTYLKDFVIRTFTAIRDRVAAVADEVWQWVSARFGWLRDAAVAIFTAIKDRVVAVFTGLRDTVAMVAQHVWDWIVARFNGLRDAAVTIFNAIKDRVVAAFTAVRDKVAAIAQNIWDWIVDKFTRLKDSAVGIFTTIRDKVGEIWNGIQAKVKEPLRVAFTFVNDNMIKPVNDILAKFPGGLKIPLLPALASGGLLRGPGTGTSDSILGVDPKTGVATAAVSNGEYVVKRSTVRQLGVGFLDRLNAGKLPGLATGGLAGRFNVPAFGLGGFVGEVFDKAKNAVSTVKDFATDMIAKGARKAAEAVLGPIVTATKATIPGDKVPMSLLVGGLDKLYQAILGKGDEKDKENAALSGGSGFGNSAGSPNGVGGLGPKAAAARAYALSHFSGISSIGGYSYRKIAGTNTLSDHATGKALDVMIANYKSAGGISAGNKIASYFVDNPSAFGTKYVIWRDAINQGKGWKPYGHPSGSGGDTLQHRDHVHVSVYDDGGILEPGKTVVHNKSGKPEAVLTNKEMQDYKRLIASGSTGGALVAGDLILQAAPGQSVKDQLGDAMFQLRKIKRGGLHA